MSLGPCEPQHVQMHEEKDQLGRLKALLRQAPDGPRGQAQGHIRQMPRGLRRGSHQRQVHLA